MRKIHLIIVCITAIILTALSGCIDTGSTEENKYYYSITLEAGEIFNYTVYAPMASDSSSNEMMEKLFNNMRLETGEGKFSIIWTEYGPALKIEANDTIKLVIEYSDTDLYHPLALSMPVEAHESDGSTEEHWLFFSSPESEPQELAVTIELKVEAGECCGEVITEGTSVENQKISSIGWQRLETEFERKE